MYCDCFSALSRRISRSGHHKPSLSTLSSQFVLSHRHWGNGTARTPEGRKGTSNCLWSHLLEGRDRGVLIRHSPKRPHSQGEESVPRWGGWTRPFCHCHDGCHSHLVRSAQPMGRPGHLSCPKRALSRSLPFVLGIFLNFSVELARRM